MKAQNNLVNIAIFRAVKGKADMLEAGLTRLVEPTRQEKGCLDYRIHRSKEEPELWMVYENWRSPADFAAHLQTDYVSDFMNKVAALLDGEPDIRQFEPVSTGRPRP